MKGTMRKIAEASTVIELWLTEDDGGVVLNSQVIKKRDAQSESEFIKDVLDIYDNSKDTVFVVRRNSEA